MLARVKQDYASGSVVAFSGHEYVRSEWRDVPAGFEEQAKKHPLLDTQPSLKEIRAGGTMAPGLTLAPADAGEDPAPEPTTETVDAVSAETADPPTMEPTAEETPPTPEPEGETKPPRSRRRRAGTEDG